MPGENVMKLGEQWEIEMPGFGKMTVSLHFMDIVLRIFSRFEESLIFRSRESSWSTATVSPPV